jgi:hypothetical protein
MATTGTALFNFTVDMHNFVNKRLGLKIFSYNEAQQRWKKTF